MSRKSRSRAQTWWQRIFDGIGKWEANFLRGGFGLVPGGGRSRLVGCGTALMSTGLAGLDEALGGGFPKGRWIELAGEPGAGKTTLALQWCRACQKQGGLVLYLDVEHALMPRWVRHLGVQPDSFALARPRDGEEAWGLLLAGLDNEAIKMIVIDTVAALAPNTRQSSKKETSSGDVLMFPTDAGENQRSWLSKRLRQLVETLWQRDCVIIFVNQLRRRNVHSHSSGQRDWGHKGSDLFFSGEHVPVGVCLERRKRAGWTTPGGTMLSFLAAARCWLWHEESLEKNGKSGGTHTLSLEVPMEPTTQQREWGLRWVGAEWREVGGD